MSGYGIRIGGGLLRQLRGRRMWRRESFLHQLSDTGSMMWAANHDRFWLQALAAELGIDADWGEARRQLAGMAAGGARGILYRASATWLEGQLTLLPELERFAFTQGLEEPAAMSALRAEIAVRSEQLKRLSWCASDTGAERIEIVS